MKTQVDGKGTVIGLEGTGGVSFTPSGLCQNLTTKSHSGSWLFGLIVSVRRRTSSVSSISFTMQWSQAHTHTLSPGKSISQMSKCQCKWNTKVSTGSQPHKAAAVSWSDRTSHDGDPLSSCDQKQPHKVRKWYTSLSFIRIHPPCCFWLTSYCRYTEPAEMSSC